MTYHTPESGYNPQAKELFLKAVLEEEKLTEDMWNTLKKTAESYRYHSREFFNLTGLDVKDINTLRAIYKQDSGKAYTTQLLIHLMCKTPEVEYNVNATFQRIKIAVASTARKFLIENNPKYSKCEKWSMYAPLRNADPLTAMLANICARGEMFHHRYFGEHPLKPFDQISEEEKMRITYFKDWEYLKKIQKAYTGINTTFMLYVPPKK
jgi:hypothetical protein